MSPAPMRLRDLPPRVNEISGIILDAAIKVHSTLGSGLLENVYKLCLVHELRERGLVVRREAPLDVVYGSLRLRDAYFADIVVEEQVVIEAKACAGLNPEHEAQLLTCMRLTGAPLGILLNFHATRLMDGGFVRRAMTYS